MPSLLEFLVIFCKKFNVENELKCYNIETNAYIIVLYANMLFLAFYSFVTYPVHHLFNCPYSRLSIELLTVVVSLLPRQARLLQS